MSFVKFCLFLSFVSFSLAENLQLNNIYELQIQNEFLASNVYLTFAHRLATEGIYPGFAEFFFDSAEEERDHGKHLIDFHNVNVFDWKLDLWNVNVNETFASMTKLPQMIRAATILEQTVYESLNQVRTLANDAQNYAMVHFIEKVMLEEQVVALKLMKDLSRRLEQAGESTLFLQMMDQRLRK